MSLNVLRMSRTIQRSSFGRHDEEGIVEVVACHHGLVEEVHGDAAGEVEEGHQHCLPVAPGQSPNHPGRCEWGVIKGKDSFSP